MLLLMEINVMHHIQIMVMHMQMFHEQLNSVCVYQNHRVSGNAKKGH